MARKTRSTPVDSPPLRLEWRSPAELAENPANWRRHPAPQIAALTDAIAEVGWAGACLFNEVSGRLIDGHARRKVALDQGTDRVPVLIGSWTPEQEAKILATLDPISAMAEADAATLADLLREVHTGSEALQHMLAELAENAGVVPPDVTPGAGGDEFDTEAALDGPCRVQPGELWLIDGGRHRLYCGDSTEQENIDGLFGAERADLVFTDPPYGVDVSGKGGDPIAGDLSFTAIPLMFDVFRWALADLAWVYVCGGQSNMLLYCKMFERYFRQLPRVIVWDKGNMILRHVGYHSCHEFIYYTFREGTGHRWFGGRNSDVADDIWRCQVERGDARVHPTQKPVALPLRAITNSCPPDGLVWDPFAGSGSTLVAAHRAGRRCYACEIDERFAEVCLARCEAEGLSVARG